MENKISRIIQNDLCLGCGLCEAISKQSKMVINSKGFYRPQPVASDKQEIDLLAQLCPGITVRQSNANNTEVWGCVLNVCNAWASDKTIRHQSSSGGVTSALAIYLLESKKVDGVLHVGPADGDWLHNELHVSRTREEILKRNASRYAPAAIFNNIFEIINKNKTEKYCFIGKPCDIAVVRNLQRIYPAFREQITHCLAIFCAGMPSYNATWDVINTFGNSSSPVSLRYRGDGWPGFFTVCRKDGSSDRMSYNDSWGKILGRQLGFRCKICPDGIGMLADISSGDSWNSKNGYPDFTEAEGKNFCFVRTSKGQELMVAATEAGYICVEPQNGENIAQIQQYQFNRRHLVGWRIAVVQMLSRGILNFKGLGFYRMAMKSNVLRGLKDAVGTASRFYSLRKKNGEF